MSQHAGSQTATDPGEVEEIHIYDGQDTEEDPFVAQFQQDDPGNPVNWSQFRKWFITTIITLSVFAFTFTSSTYSASPNEVTRDFYINSTKAFIVGVSLFVLGSEVYGRQILWVTSHVAMVAFIGGSAGSRNITTLLVLRFFGGTFGGSPLVNSGGTIAEFFPRLSTLSVIFAPGTYGQMLLIRRARHLSKPMERYISNRRISLTTSNRWCYCTTGRYAFAWTNYPSIHWSVGIILSAPSGFGCVLVILPIVNHLIDSYNIYAASVLAAAAIFRSIVGAVFPLFTTQMYKNLGIHWVTSVPAPLTLACMPFPVVMYRYGGGLRMKCRYAFEVAEMMRRMRKD
ncbi:hypothetical protein DL768_001139 [Monosporascus sp. mg162]|nr:hypothetical protein DL768_001139 [Monosporascus sp. mg162]